MGFALRDGLHFAVPDDRAVFLDLVGDRYFRLPEALDRAFRILVADEDASIAPGMIGSLLDKGVIARTETTTPLGAPAITAATRSFAEFPPATAIGVASALVRQMRAAALLRREPLHAILGRLARRKERLAAARQSPPSAKLMRILSAHGRSNALLSAHDRCLAKSIALMEALLRQGYPGELVLGVQDRPFAAHFWVQMDGMVLNDSADHVRTFFPIFAV